MSSAIIGFGAIGQALARAFTRKNLQVTVTSRRAPEVIAPEAKAIGPTVTASLLQDALKAQIVILAVPFGVQNELEALTWCGGPFDPTRADLPALEADIDRLARRWARRPRGSAKARSGRNRTRTPSLPPSPVGREGAYDSADP